MFIGDEPASVTESLGEQLQVSDGFRSMFYALEHAFNIFHPEPFSFLSSKLWYSVDVWATPSKASTWHKERDDSDSYAHRQCLQSTQMERMIEAQLPRLRETISDLKPHLLMTYSSVMTLWVQNLIKIHTRHTCQLC